MSASAKDMPTVKLESPRFENRRPLRIAGLVGRYSANTLDDLPALWERRAVHIGGIPGQIGRAAYGVCSDMLNRTSGFSTDKATPILRAKPTLPPPGLSLRGSRECSVLPVRRPRHFGPVRFGSGSPSTCPQASGSAVPDRQFPSIAFG